MDGWMDTTARMLNWLVEPVVAAAVAAFAFASFKYTGAFEIKHDAKESADIDFVIVKVGDVTGDASSDLS
jgi:hypothetical protein